MAQHAMWEEQGVDGTSVLIKGGSSQAQHFIGYISAMEDHLKENQAREFLFSTKRLLLMKW